MTHADKQPEAGVVGATPVANSQKPDCAQAFPKRTLALALGATALLATATATALEAPKPPVAAKRDHAVTAPAGCSWPA